MMEVVVMMVVMVLMEVVAALCTGVVGGREGFVVGG